MIVSSIFRELTVISTLLCSSTYAAEAVSWYSGQLQVIAPGNICATDYNGQPGSVVNLNSDANLVIFRNPDPATIAWNSGGTSPGCANGGCTLYFQTDGNLVVYGPGSIPLWNSGTAGVGARLACLDQYPYFMIFRADGWLIWYPRIHGESTPVYTIFGCSHLKTEPWLCI